MMGRMLIRTLVTTACLVFLSSAKTGISEEGQPKTYMRCDIHGTDLVPTEVPLHYGFPEAQEGLSTSDYQRYKTDKAAGFPRAVRHVNGGCVVPENAPETRIVPVCPICMTNEHEWWEDLQRRRQEQHEKKIQAMSDQEFQRMIDSIERMMQDPRILENDEQLKFLEEQLILLRRIRSGDGIPPTPAQE